MKRIDAISAEQKESLELQDILSRLDNLKEQDLPTQEMMKIIGSPHMEHFIGVVKQIFPDLYFTGNIQQDSNILDIGTGCGRMALPFVDFLQEGKYYGLDVWDEGIQWCKNHISSKNDHFDFRTINAMNNYYFDDDNEQENNFVIDNIPDNSIDFIFAISVFTHLNPDDTLQYFQEFSRILKPDAKAYITTFIIDDAFFSFVEQTGNHQAVRETATGFYSAYTKQHFFSGYTMDLWTELLEKAGLKITGYEPGLWAQKESALRYQDTFVIEKI